MTLSPAQIRQALINTMQQPRNEASLINEALKREQANKAPAKPGFRSVANER